MAEAGRQLVVGFGCSGCHTLAGKAFRDLGKAGPDLRRIAAKTDPAWALAWVMAPRKLQATAWMPHFLEETDEADGRAIVAYLWQHSQPVEYRPQPVGDAARGEELFNAVGCTGCHLRDARTRGRDEADAFRLHGPNLIHLGSKVKAPWLFAWLKNPRQFVPETRMPNLRLSDVEAADLTAFLMASRSPGQEASPLDPWEEGDVEAGQEAIDLYACHGCHAIAGFEDAAKPAGPLTSVAGFTGHGLAGLPNFALSPAEVAAIDAGLRDAASTEGEVALTTGRWLVVEKGCRGCHRMEGRGQALAAPADDLGLLPPNLHGEGSRVKPVWLGAYLEDPSQVRLRPWLPARMPTFSLGEEEIQGLVAYFSALEPRSLALAPAALPSAQRILRGREVFDLMPCGECHPESVENLESLSQRSASLGPPLSLARQRLRYEWMGEWIRDPQSWMPGTRMPTFFLSSRSGGVLSPFEPFLDSPLLVEAKARLRADGSSAEEVDAFLSDAEAMIDALGEYIWSLGPQGPEALP